MVSIIIGIIIYTLHCFNALGFLYISIVFAFGVILRLIAFYKNWELPNIYNKR